MSPPCSCLFDQTSGRNKGETTFLIPNDGILISPKFYPSYHQRLVMISSDKHVNIIGNCLNNTKCIYSDLRLFLYNFAIGMNTGICIPNSVAAPKENVPCTCEPGYRLIAVHSKSGPDKYECSPCPIGLVSSGNTSTCSSCSAGRAAIPGLFFTLWPNGPLPKQFKTECAGAGCGKASILNLFLSNNHNNFTSLFGPQFVYQSLIVAT